MRTPATDTAARPASPGRRMTGDRHSGNFRFGPFLLQTRERRLLQDGVLVPLEPRTFDLLATLVANAGSLVTKDELLERIWTGRVVEESNVHVHISTLRKAVGKHAIATVPRHGYRFTVAVEAFAVPAAMPAEERNNLPQRLASFVGREDDLAQLQERLGEARLVTLSGIGGSGKTRLAIKLAERVVPSFPDGVWFVDLAPVAEPERVARAVATSLAIREERDTPITETLVRHCGARRMLLVLDNCEHVVAACASLVERLLTATSALRVLATSRERLGLPGERVIPMRSLTIPPEGVAHDARALLVYESVRLFVDRAREIAPEFAIGPDNAAAVAEVCRRLDGIPLALELAAALIELLSAEQIRDRLDDRFRLLTGSTRADARHRTLLATLTSSYACLAPDEQRCFARLSVFTGGWTLAAAAAVVGEGDEISTLKRLGRLVDKSLVHVVRATGGEPRYGMPETVRQFARDMLEASGMCDDARERHLAHFLALARSAQAQFFGPAMRDWLARLDAELPNILSAIAWCEHASEGVRRGLELATNLRSYWLARGLFALGERVYDDALARTGGDPRAMQRGKALYALGQHHYVRGRLLDALPPTQEALSIAREHGDDEFVVYCLDRICLASSWLGNTAQARGYADEELVVAKRSANQRLMGFALTAQGGVCRAEGDFEAAARAFESALELFERGQDLNNRYNALVDVARVSIARGALERARDTVGTAIALIDEMGTTYRGHFALEAAARLASARADWTRAARLQGASDSAVDAAGGTRTWFDDRVLAALHAKPAAMLAADAHTAAYDAGRALPLETALAEASAWLADAHPWNTG
jgi:predicted ATPase/DNA-binding winged helix-turn-helix (wHTH) protein